MRGGDRQAFWRECPANVPGNRYLDADIGGGKSEDRIYLRRQPENMDKVFEGSWHDGRSRGSSSKFATKCEEVGVDAIVAEGFEAGGHNGREETTTMCLIPAVRKATSLPLLAAGGIGNGQAMLAALALGADGVQIGTRFALTKESSAHENFKKLCLNLKEGDTKLLLKKLSPTRLVKGDFATAVEEAEARGASVEELRELLGKGRAKKGIFEGDLKEGELEIGQVASLFWEELSVEEVMKELIRDFKLSLENVKTQLCS